MLSTASVLPFKPSQAQYEHVARLLCRFGRVPGVPLKPSEFRVLCFLSGQQPGYHGHQYTIGDELDGVGHDTIHRALHALKDKNLLEIEPVFEGQPLRQGIRSAPTRTCRYYLRHEVHALLSAEEARRARETRDKAIAAPPVARTPAPDDLTWAEPEIQRIAAAFDALELRRPCGTAELLTLRKRLAQGVGLETLTLAVSGASATRWTRADGSHWCRDAFAVVFASRQSVERMAQQGLALRRGPVLVRPTEGVAAAEPSPAAPEVASPMTAKTPSPTRSQEIVDPEPLLKITTAGAGESREDRGTLRAPIDASETPSDVGAIRAVASAAPPSGPTPLRLVAVPAALQAHRFAPERARDEGEHDARQGVIASPPTSPPEAPAASSRVVTLAGRPVTVTTSPQAAMRHAEAEQMQRDMQTILTGMTPDFLRPRGPNGERVPPGRGGR